MFLIGYRWKRPYAYVQAVVVALSFGEANVGFECKDAHVYSTCTSITRPFERGFGSGECHSDACVARWIGYGFLGLRLACITFHRAVPHGRPFVSRRNSMQLVVQFGASRDRSVLLFLSNSPQLMQWLKRAMQSEKQSTDGIRVYGAGRGEAQGLFCI